MDHSKAKALVEKYKSGTLNKLEQGMLEDWYAKLADTNKLNLEEMELDQNLDDIWDTIRFNTLGSKTKHQSLLLWRKVTAVAVVLLVVTVGLYFYRQNWNKDHKMPTQYAEGIKPGGNHATLTLANGKVIALDDVDNGKLAEQAGITITKTTDGQLVYTVDDRAGSSSQTTQALNTISTPKGGQYQINLPDGSRVWLNAASSLRYPVRFSGNERKVTLTGEAYFEVTKEKHLPFIVVTDKQQVEVLGTHFNINAYTDEPGIKTTLLEGAVKVGMRETEKDDVLLKPGEQCNLNGNTLSVSTVNTDEAVAWKNGMFLFKDADLKTVMRAVARWYDVEVTYEGALPAREFSGEIYRNLNLNQVLDVLSFYKVHFRVEGKKIIVKP
uniref:FecR family protein n=1 Tax=Pedobacter schmidteae TaxID=2201271 RepID=UPI000EB4C54F|nr:FecR domain-containing protein [Pedobacter schmidteae]